MRRTLWFVAGAGAGIYGVTKVRRLLESFTPDGMRDRLSGLSLGLHVLSEEFTTAATQREYELRRELEAATLREDALTSSEDTKELE